MQDVSVITAQLLGKRWEKPLLWSGELHGRRAHVRRQRLVILTLLFSDVLLALLVWAAAGLLQGGVGAGDTLSEIAVAGVAAWVGIRALLGLYPGYGLDHVEELRRQTYAVAAALTITAVFALALDAGNLYSRLALLSGFLGLALLAPVFRSFSKRWMAKSGLWGKPVAVLGPGEEGAQVVSTLRREWRLGFKPVAVLDERLVSKGRELDLAPYEAPLAEAEILAKSHGVDTIILAMSRVRREILAEIVGRLNVTFRNVTVVPDIGGIANSAVAARDFGGILGVEIRQNLLDPWAQRVKRAVDLVVTVLGGVLILPLLLMISLFVLIESRGSVFYRDVRMGRDGKPFSCIKFRTMVSDAEAVLRRMLEEDAELRKEYFKYHKLRRDPRVTRIGWVLRKTSLDELPQLWNVLKGEMSLVGPRPYQTREAGDVGAAQNELLRVTPGITGLWQVSGRNHTSFGDRVLMDAYYVRNWSVWLDFVILARTMECVLLRKGAY